jgi:hypothetical protein
VAQLFTSPIEFTETTLHHLPRLVCLQFNCFGIGFGSFLAMTYLDGQVNQRDHNCNRANKFPVIAQ